MKTKDAALLSSAHLAPCGICKKKCPVLPKFTVLLKSCEIIIICLTRVLKYFSELILLRPFIIYCASPSFWTRALAQALGNEMRRNSVSCSLHGSLQRGSVSVLHPEKQSSAVWAPAGPAFSCTYLTWLWDNNYLPIVNSKVETLHAFFFLVSKETLVCHKKILKYRWIKWKWTALIIPMYLWNSVISVLIKLWCSAHSSSVSVISSPRVLTEHPGAHMLSCALPFLCVSHLCRYMHLHIIPLL